MNEEKIVGSWIRNSDSWTVAVREARIRSRTLVTNDAIVDAVLDRAPETVLDLGCGEGWLSRALATRGIRVVGVDVVPTFVDAAKKAGGGDFYLLSYEELATGKLKLAVDTIVCNFALFGETSVEGLFRTVPTLLNPRGSFIVQTLHPLMACGDLPYEDGWRKGSWSGFSEDFTDPAPWYFRRLESWVNLFVENGFRLVEVREPLHPATGKPASVIFVGMLVP